MNLAAQAPGDAIRHLLPLVERAVQAHRHGATDTAEKLCLEVLELAPTQLGALTTLYNIRKAQGVPRATEALIRRIVALDPNNLWATNEIALMLMSKGALAEAEVHARNAVRIAPENPQSHNLMGMILTEQQRPVVGEYHYRRVLELSQNRDPIVLANLAWNLKTQGKTAEARTLYDESTTAAPKILQTVLGWARLEEVDRNFEAASGLLDRAEELAPKNPSVWLARAVVLGRKRKYEEALVTLDAIASQTQDGSLGPNELLEKGRLLDQMGRYDEAFVAFQEGKRKAREVSGHAYMADHAAQLVERLKRFFTTGRLKIIPRATPLEAQPQPLFILGFPRSGTTLVEQTLTAHPRIAAGDELPFIAEITGIMPKMFDSPLGYPEALAELWMGDHREGLDNLRDYYLQKVRQLGILRDDAPWFTDKMPLNETHIGLIALLFPQSPMIHVLRHPLDVVTSVFSNHLTHGFFCSYELETAARHYALIMDLVEHYRREMALRYLAIRYEDIVFDQEASVRRMLDFIGEDFDPRCLRFEENTRYARTASYAQVTEKLYDRSRYRHRHYRKQLEPVLPILQPTIERLGYTIE
jgi:tetratricopeptide (TPR) repeat protein